jgi:hypothetical protein
LPTKINLQVLGVSVYTGIKNDYPIQNNLPIKNKLPTKINLQVLGVSVYAGILVTVVMIFKVRALVDEYGDAKSVRVRRPRPSPVMERS